MHLTLWILLFLFHSALYGWIVFGGGAEWLEDTFLVTLLVHFRAQHLDSEGIRAMALVLWIGMLFWFVMGIRDPDLRPFS
jgi:hypothetical protein